MKTIAKIIFLILFSRQIMAKEVRLDSIGIMVDTLGKIIVLHKVEKGETYYSIARRYNIEPKKLIEFNKRGKIFLDLGDTVRVPTKDNLSLSKKIKLTEDEIIHIVGSGDNLYQISIKYNVTIPDIKLWNNLLTNNLNIGQEIIIKKNQNTILNGSNIEEEPEEKNLSFNKIKEINESGVGGWINSKYLNPQKSLALHKTAPIGTIIKVANKMNNKSIYVKVIGVLPNTDENERIIILISKSAKEYLGILDERFQCDLVYSINL